MATASLFLGERLPPHPTTADFEATPRPVFVPPGPPVSLSTLAARLETGEAEVLEELGLAPELRTRIGLRTLRRRADKRGRAPLLRCVTREVQALARAAGWRTELVKAPIEVIDPEEQTSTRTWPQLPAVRVPSVRVPAVKVPSVAAAVGAVLVVGVLVGLVYPSASVTVVPAAEAWQVELPVIVDPNIKKAEPAAGKLPGRAITREVSETATAPATGKKTVPDGKASGEVVLLNRSDQPVNVPKGTVVLAGAVKFATQSDVTVAPSRRAGSAQIFGMSNVKIQAITGGTAGNVDRNRIDKIEGPLAASLSVQNSAPLRGGTERQATFVTEDDRRKLQDALYRTLSERLSQQLKTALPASDKETLVPWTGLNPAVIEASYSKAADEEAQSFSLTLKVRYGATAFVNDAYNQLVRELAQHNATKLRPGYTLARESVQAEPPTVAAVESGSVRLVGRARATVVPQLDQGRLRAALVGKPVAAARDHLGQLQGMAGYALSVNTIVPGRMPALGWRIGVRAQAPAA